MAVLLDRNTRLIVQGLTGREGTFHAKAAAAYGTNVVGGGANAEQIRNAFKILMSDANVKAVLINIFGGILRCDVLAAGVVAAVKELSVNVPIVVRMEGTNVEEGKRILRDSGLKFTTADSMGEAAETIVAQAAAFKKQGGK